MPPKTRKRTVDAVVVDVGAEVVEAVEVAGKDAAVEVDAEDVAAVAGAAVAWTLPPKTRRLEEEEEATERVPKEESQPSWKEPRQARLRPSIEEN